MTRTLFITVTAAALTLGIPLGANAQNQTQSQAKPDSGPLASAKTVSLDRWNYDELYKNGWRANELIDTEAYSPKGNEIGEVENILVGPDGNIRSIIVAAGGFLGIGDAHFAVPWNKVQVSPRMERVTVPITEANYNDFDLFGASGFDVTAKPGSGVRRVEEGSAGNAQPRVWRVSELIGDTVRLKDRADYGYVDDLLFDRNGKLTAVVVEPRFTGNRVAAGPYAVPYYGYGAGFEPGLDYYGLPYSSADVTNLQRFDEKRMTSATTDRNAGNAGSSGAQPGTTGQGGSGTGQ
ncbi:PRC-barrel domain-containing protein [Azospirillum rugosum]|uniref:Sporulation protein YlmC with PRC-barrel domain n=1 Tax=Azospirillum rugosum TaxID=416170 RepID=A0ABS4SR60_9PROT|nr:PRC-barrel domain-containing protein [Azospirillum rugosum]MBP2295056.1 sporulation protein YlmC with PRC-barrel domain [Azospirillum rugosum]MDQ0528879.1 sporulation protein YlmC with PRC-barrel domain [Azospirillum rugosum]